jgi:hypothetical protein
MKKQRKVFSIDGKMQVSAEADAHVGTWVDLAPMFGLLVSTFNMTVSKQSEIEKRHLQCDSSFSTEYKSLQTLPMEEFQTILLAWLKKASNASTDEPHLREKALRIAAHLDI